MARDLHTLTWAKVLRTNKRGVYGDGGGLYLRVGPTGAKSWIFRYRWDDRLVDMGLGPIHTFNLAEARDRARELRQDLDAARRGKALDPLAAQRAAKDASRVKAAKAITFRQCAERYVEAHEAAWRHQRTAAQWLSSLEVHAYKVLGDLSVDKIDTPLVLQVLEPIWRTIPEHASRVRQRIEAVLTWATVREYRTGENPARWRGHLSELLPKKSKVKPTEHHPALPYTEIAGFIAELRTRQPVAAIALEFGILTAARTNEVLGARWKEIDLKQGVWIVPPERMKSGREHRVPLSEAAMTVLRKIERHGELVFPGTNRRPLAHDALHRELKRVRPSATVHGFRSTFAQWAAERTNHSFEVREMALAHTVGNTVERSYQRSDLFDRRRRLMNEWARWCAGLGGEVVALRVGGAE